jgi:hypothetical protein
VEVTTGAILNEPFAMRMEFTDDIEDGGDPSDGLLARPEPSPAPPSLAAISKDPLYMTIDSTEEVPPP